ncbi:Putative ribonuclease H protein At1g65750 [Linum perenne]
MNGLQWSIRDGKGTKFWTDVWLDSGATLIDFALNIQGVNSNASVSDFCLPNGSWDFPKLDSCLPSALVLQVGGMTPPRAEAGKDVLVWGLEDNGKFSIKSAYALLKDFRLDERNGKWQKIWSWQGPNRIKHFLWVVLQDKLLTNLERARRHLTASDLCAACTQVPESLDHLFRSCQIARSIWNECLPDVLSATQQSLSFQEWWVSNISNTRLNPSFGVIAWLIWKRRNMAIFEDVNWSTAEVRNQVKFWVLLLSSSWKAGQLGREAPGSARQTQLIGWRPADEGWFTLNSDGSLYTQTGRAAAGGLIRDSGGNLITSFVMNLGACSIMRAELRGIVEGMKIAWEAGIRRLCIQTDSRAAVALLSSSDGRLHRHANLVEQFSDLRNRDWEVTIHHIFREANSAADYLANLGHSFDLGCHVVEVPDNTLMYWLRYDLIGVCTPRLVNNIT